MSQPGNTGVGRGSGFRGVIEKFIGPLTRRNVLAWVVVIGAVLGIRWLWFEPFSIPTDSMYPTLDGDMRFLRGDRVAANKYIYGPRLPFMNHRIFKFKKPKRWEIVVFKAVEEDAEHGTLVKRVAGLPGERVQIRNGHVWINGERCEFPDSMPDDVYYVNTNDLRRLMYAFRDPEDRKSMQERLERYPMRYGVRPEEKYSVVPDGCYFVLGDNSMNSVDGRMWGWVPNSHIVGRVFCIWWPVSRWRDFTGFSDTWWGMAILYGVPALFILHELLYILRRRSAGRRARQFSDKQPRRPDQPAEDDVQDRRDAGGSDML